MVTQQLAYRVRHYDIEQGKAQLPVGVTNDGYIEGYLAVFNVVDLHGERIRPGAFSKSIAERVSKGKVPLMLKHFAHGGDAVDVAGVITEAKEDDYGVWIHAEFLNTDLAQNARKTIVSSQEKGVQWYFSIGYIVLNYTNVLVGDEYVKELIECKLCEGTVTLHPVNENCLVVNAKSLNADDLSAGRDTRSREEGSDKQASCENTGETVVAGMDKTIRMKSMDMEMLTASLTMKGLVKWMN